MKAWFYGIQVYTCLIAITTVPFSRYCQTHKPLYDSENSYDCWVHMAVLRLNTEAGAGDSEKQQTLFELVQLFELR